MFDGYEYGSWNCGFPVVLLFVKVATSLEPTDHPLIALAVRRVSINLPYPPRITVLLLPPTRQANPMRGAKSRFEESRKPEDTPTDEARITGVLSSASTN